MGVVRRTGDWRLEKREEGVYEITFRREAQLRVVTPKAPVYERNGMTYGSIRIDEVGSYSEAEGLFEELAHGPPPFGMQYSSEEGTAESDNSVEWLKLPAGLLGGILLVVAVIFMLTFIDSGNTVGLTIALLAGLAGILPFIISGYYTKQSGWRKGLAVLITPTEQLARGGYFKKNNSTPEQGSSLNQQNTAPIPQKRKEELFFERANRHCEYCDQTFDQPHVHHIKPRSEGGTNNTSNLVVLCPNCHTKADRGMISRSKLRYIVREKEDALASEGERHLSIPHELDTE